MAISGIKFTIDADNTKSLSAIKQVMYAAKDAGKQIQEAFGAKLKQVISVTAIEEGIRRTAEWAAEVDRFSKSLNISREAMQTLNVISQRTGTSMDTVQGMFENINKARNEALKGNQDMIKSFARLGVAMSDLKKMTPSQLFSETMGKINIDKSDNLQRAAIQDITGTPEGTIEGFQEGMDGKSFTETQSDLLKEGSIQPEEVVGGIAKQWADLKSSGEELWTSMAPIVEILLGIFRMMVDTLGAVFDVINSLGSILMGIVTLDGEKIKKAFMDLFGLFANLGYGLGKFVTGILELIPGVKKLGMTEGIQKIQDEANKGAGISKKMIKHGEGAGEMLGTYLGGELIGAAGRTSLGNKIVNKALNPIGVDATAYTEGMTARQAVPKKFGIHKKRESLSLKTRNAIDSQIKRQMENLKQKPVKELTLEETEALKWYEQWSQDIGKKMGNETGFSTTKKSLEGNKLEQFMGKWGSKGLSAVGKYLPISATSTTAGWSEAQEARKGAKPITERGPISPMFSGGISGMGDIGGSANLKIGGMFGQSTNKLIKLNTDMVTLLSVIKDNTSIFANNQQLSGGGSNNFGGMSGGM
jgi:hypothetical protein